MPRVSVLLVAHQAGPLLRRAVASVLGQTWRDLELVLVDNASPGASVLNGHGQDPRVVPVRLERNLGAYGGALAGLPHCSGELIARMDGDDVCLPHRLARQVAWLDAEPTLTAVGSWVWTVWGNSLPRGWIRHPTAPADVARMARYDMPVVHPTLVGRRVLFEEVGYRDLPASADFDLVVRACERGLQIANVPEHLLRYRVHGGSITVGRTAAQAAYKVAVRRAAHRRRQGQPEAFDELVAAAAEASASGRSPARVLLEGARQLQDEGDAAGAALTALEAARLAAQEGERMTSGEALALAHGAGGQRTALVRVWARLPGLLRPAARGAFHGARSAWAGVQWLGGRP